MYPHWEPPIASNRSGAMDTPNLSDGILGPAPMSAQTAGMSSGLSSGLSSGWGGGSGLVQKNVQGQSMRVRVVVVKYERRPLSDKSIFNFVEPFGQLKESLLLKNKAFLEMSSHDEALDVVNYYQQNPATLGGKPLAFQLSNRVVLEKPMTTQRGFKPVEQSVIRKVRDDTPAVSQVVYFSNLPREEDKRKDLLTIAGRFGTVEKHLFLHKEGFIQLSSPREAEMMEKYYSMNPLVIGRQQLRCNVCTKYKTLNVPQQGDSKSPASTGTYGARPNRSSSPRRSTDRKRSPSPKPRTKGERRKEERSRSKPEPKESKPEPKESKPEPKESKSESKQESKSKPETKPETKAKPESKPESTAKLESKPDSKAKADSGAEQRASAVKEEGCSDNGELESTQLGQEVEEEEEREEKVTNGGGHPENTSEEDRTVEKVKGAESEETKDSVIADTEESIEGDLHEDEEEFLENMDDMVVVDEIEEEDANAIDNSEKGGMRVVLIMGFKKGYNHLSELMQLAQPFGKVVRHLVLDVEHKAYLQFSTEEEAVAMAKFYNGNVQASVCGRPVKIWHYTAQPTLQFGFVVYIGKLPDSKFTKEEVLELVEKFGKVRKYFLHYIRRECFIEMETEEQAERVVEHYREHPAVMSGHRLTIYVSRKYRVLRGRHVVIPGSERKTSKREKESSSKRKLNEEPPAKKNREERTDKRDERKEKKEEATEEGGDADVSMEDVDNEREGGDERKEEASKEGGDERKEEASKEAGDEEKQEEASKEGGNMPMEEEGEERREEAAEEEGDKDEEREEETSAKVEERRGGNDEQSLEEADGDLQKTGDGRPDQGSDQGSDQSEEEMTDQDTRETETPPSESDAPPPDSKSSVASLPLPPYDPHTPLGVEYVKMGYYCRICFLFYSNEDTAKRTHCSSQSHYDKLQKYLEKKKTAPK